MTISRILVPTDFGPASDAALSYASDLSAATGATLHLLHVVDDVAARLTDFPYARVDEIQTSVELDARRHLQAVADRRDVTPAHPQAAVLTSLNPADAIVSYAADEHIDLIVMGTHGRAPVVRMFLGAVADRVVRTAPCPVMTVRTTQSAPGDQPQLRPLVATSR
jgi:nucleotide-binding universal stress UspA family protein